MTNADKIKTMSNRELAKLLVFIKERNSCFQCPASSDWCQETESCIDEFEIWLAQEFQKSEKMQQCFSCIYNTKI